MKDALQNRPWTSMLRYTIPGEEKYLLFDTDLKIVNWREASERLLSLRRSNAREGDSRNCQ
jgi:hypothetical protein